MGVGEGPGVGPGPGPGGNVGSQPEKTSRKNSATAVNDFIIVTSRKLLLD
jgi:hypothetical protein